MFMNHTFIRLIAVIVMAGFLTSCAKALPFQKSGITSPAFWKRADASSSVETVMLAQEQAQIEHAWWKHFNDPTLSHLINHAIDANKTLGIAIARVEEARAAVAYGHANQLPDFNGVVEARRANDGVGSDEKTRNTFNASVQATWEIDIFQRNLPRLDQAKAILQSADASRQAVLVGLLAEVGRTYFDLLNYKRQIEITEKNLTNQKRTVELIKAQQQGALASDFDVLRSEAQVSSTESNLPGLRAAYDAALNRLNVLLGGVPGAHDDMIQTPVDLQPLDQKIIVAAPATVLANRPDVKVAERNFAASISGAQAASRKFFPKISLLSFFGVQDTTTLSAFPVGAGLTLVQPLLDFGRIRTQINVANAQQEQAFFNYQQTVLEALENMENALTVYKNEVVRNGILQKSVEQNRKSADFAQQQFQSGFTALLDVLVAQGNVLAAESALAASDMALRKNLINIYTASGGGWQVDEPKVSSVK